VKKWSQCSGMSGHNAAEWVVTMQRNGWSQCSGMGGHNAAEYAMNGLKRPSNMSVNYASTIIKTPLGKLSKLRPEL